MANTIKPEKFFYRFNFIQPNIVCVYVCATLFVYIWALFLHQLNNLCQVNFFGYNRMFFFVFCFMRLFSSPIPPSQAATTRQTNERKKKTKTYIRIYIYCVCDTRTWLPTELLLLLLLVSLLFNFYAVSPLLVGAWAKAANSGNVAMYHAPHLNTIMPEIFGREMFGNLRFPPS